MVKPTTFRANAEPKRGPGQRRRYTKTKFGCRTCKIRKVRCDETWPTCNNCKRTGRECDGVAQPDMREPNGVTFIQPLTLSHFQASKVSSLTPDEANCMDVVVCHRLLRCIVGDVGRSSWHHLMKQAVSREPALFNAVVAFSALCNHHDEAKKTMRAWDPMATGVPEDVQLAIRNYGPCVLEMQNTMGDGEGRSISVVLLCTLVCVCFELLMNSPDMAICHLDCGLQILVRNADVVDKDLARAFARFDLQASVFLGLRPPLLASNSLELVYHSPRKASTHEDGELAGLMNALFSFLRTKADDYRYRVPGSIPLDLLIEAKTIERRLHEFRENHLGKEITSRSTRMPSVTEAHLRVRCLTGTILAATSLHAEEAIYDQFTCDFLGIVDAASEILSQVPMSPVSEGSSPRPSAEISLDVAVIHPLYMTASKCRSSLIRRRAIELLRTAPSLEAAWDARSYANIAERLMQLEEACLEEQQPTDPAVVPEWCRIHSADIYPQNDGKLAKVVFRYRPNGMDGEWTDFSEMIAW